MSEPRKTTPEQNVKKARTSRNAVIFTLSVIACLVFANIVATRVFGRLDLTEDRIYTLSDASKQLVASLPDRVVAKAFLSKDTPPQVAQISKYLRDLLDEYKAASKGKFEWEAIDPADAKTEEERRKKEEEAQRLGVQKLQLQQLSQEKVSVGSIYLGVAFQYGDKIERLPRVTGLEGLEYEISSMLKRLTVKKKKIGFVSGQGELDQQRGIGFVWGGVEENYEVTPVNLGGGTPPPIGEDIDALVIMGPKQPFSDAAKRAIDQFLMKGKAAAFLVDGMTLESPQGQLPPEMAAQMPRMAKKNDVGLETLLGAYGFKIQDDILMDEQNIRAPALVNGQIYVINQPYFPIATRLGHHDTTEKVRGAVFPLASSVELQGKLKEIWDKHGNAELVPIAQSTERGWRQTGFFMFDPAKQVEPANERGVYTFGWAYKGPLASAFEKDQPTPAQSSSESPSPAGKLSESKSPVRLVVVGDSDFGSDEFMRSPDIRLMNGHLFMNIIDWLAQDEALRPIRGKGVTNRPLTVESPTTPVLVKTANMFGLPLAFIGYGLFRRWRRKHQKETP